MSLWIQNVTACPVRTLCACPFPLPSGPAMSPHQDPSPVSALCDGSLAPLYESAGTKCDTGWGLRPMVTMETM